MRATGSYQFPTASPNLKICFTGKFYVPIKVQVCSCRVPASQLSLTLPDDKFCPRSITKNYNDAYVYKNASDELIEKLFFPKSFPSKMFLLNLLLRQL